MNIYIEDFELDKESIKEMKIILHESLNITELSEESVYDYWNMLPEDIKSYVIDWTIFSVISRLKIKTWYEQTSL